MNLQRRIAALSGILFLLSLVVAIILNFFEFSFASNLSLGLFSSGILICGTAIVTYFYERNRAVLSLYNGCHDFMEALNKNLRVDNRIGIYELKDNLEEMQKVYKKEVYFYICQLLSMNKHFKLTKIIKEIWESVRKVYLLVVEDNSKVCQFLIGDISEDEIRSYTFKYTSGDSIKQIKCLQEALDKLSYHMNYYNIRKGKNSKEEHDHAD